MGSRSAGEMGSFSTLYINGVNIMVIGLTPKNKRIGVNSVLALRQKTLSLGFVLPSSMTLEIVSHLEPVIRWMVGPLTR